MEVKDYRIHIRVAKDTKELFDVLAINSGKSKSEFMNILMESYILMNSSVASKVDDIYDLTKLIYEFVQIPVKSYGNYPTDNTEIQQLINKKSKYESYIKTKLYQTRIDKKEK